MEWITNPQALIALLTLTVLEIVLGIDNIIFISILSGRLPKEGTEEGAVNWAIVSYDNKDTFTSSQFR